MSLFTRRNTDLSSWSPLRSKKVPTACWSPLVPRHNTPIFSPMEEIDPATASAIQWTLSGLMAIVIALNVYAILVARVVQPAPLQPPEHTRFGLAMSSITHLAASVTPQVSSYID